MALIGQKVCCRFIIKQFCVSSFSCRIPLIHWKRHKFLGSLILQKVFYRFIIQTRCTTLFPIMSFYHQKWHIILCFQLCRFFSKSFAGFSCTKRQSFLLLDWCRWPIKRHAFVGKIIVAFTTKNKRNIRHQSRFHFSRIFMFEINYFLP